jgi:hypothetical protein
MAQVVIFAPVGEDVEAGKKALEDAGHDVEVVEATAINLLHMAVGMMDEEPTEETPIEEPSEETPIEEPTGEPVEEPVVAEPPADAAQEPTTEAVSNLTVSVDGERIDTFIDTSRSFPLLRVVDLSGDAKVSYKLNESEFSFWRECGNTPTIQVEGQSTVTCKVQMGHAKNRPQLILDEATAKALQLL